MNSEQYTLVALAARYWFCALMVLIAFRAWRVTVIDNRRAALLRAWSPETGCIGEFVINPGKAKRQVSVPIPREGVLGSSRRADVHIAGKDVKRYHATLEEREGGLLVTTRGRAEALLNGAHAGEALFMRDGDTLLIGKTKLLLVMFEPDPTAKGSDEFSDEAIWREFDAPAPKPKATKRGKGKSNSKSKKWDDEPDLQAFEDDIWPDE